VESQLTYIDLFAGAGGLSEGFIRQGFRPVAHVEMDQDACDTLKTRLAYHYLLRSNNSQIYNSYLKNNISRDTLWEQIPSSLIDSVINTEISKRTIDNIFLKIDSLFNKNKVDFLNLCF